MAELSEFLLVQSDLAPHKRASHPARRTDPVRDLFRATTHSALHSLHPLFSGCHLGASLGPGPLFSLSFSTLTDRPALSDFSTLTLTLGQPVKIHFPLGLCRCIVGQRRPDRLFLQLPSPVSRPFARSLRPPPSPPPSNPTRFSITYPARNLERVEVNRDFLLVTERTGSLRLRVFFPPTNLRSPNPTDRPVLLLGHYPSARHPPVSEIDPSVAARISLLDPLGHHSRLVPTCCCEVVGPAKQQNSKIHLALFPPYTPGRAHPRRGKTEAREGGKGNSRAL